MTAEARVRLVVKRRRCSEHGVAEHALLYEESALGRPDGRPSGRRRRRQLRRVVCLVCDPREFVRLRAHYRR